MGNSDLTVVNITQLKKIVESLFDPQIFTSQWNVKYINSEIIKVGYKGILTENDVFFSDTNDILYVLDINGSTYIHSNCKINGNLTVNGSTNIKSLNISALNNYGFTNLYKDLYVGSNTNISGNLSVNNVSINNDLSVDGNTTITGITSLIGDTNIMSNLNVSQNTTILNNLSVFGNTIISGNTSILGDASITNISVSQNANILGKLNVNQNASIMGNLYVNQSTNILGNLQVTQNASILGNVSLNQNATISGNLNVNNNTIINGNITTSGVINTTNNINVSKTITSNDIVCKNTLNIGIITQNTNPLRNNILYVEGTGTINTLYADRIFCNNIANLNTSTFDLPSKNITDFSILNKVVNLNASTNVTIYAKALIGDIKNVSIDNTNIAKEPIDLLFNTYGTFIHGVYNTTSNLSNISSYFDLKASNYTPTGIEYTGPVSITSNMSLVGDLNITGNIYAYSDINIKDNIIQLNNCLTNLEHINGYRYTRKDNINKEQIFIGLIAQEVEKIYPELINMNNDIKSINYNSMIAVLIESIKELNNEIKLLKEKNKILV